MPPCADRTCGGLDLAQAGPVAAAYRGRMTDLAKKGLAVLGTVEKLVRSPFGGVPPRPPSGTPEDVRVLGEPPRTGGATLLEALAARRSVREFAPDPLPPALLSGLLWAAGGVNRADGGRTAPSAVAMHAVDIYAALADGLYRYDPQAHALRLVQAADVRRLTGLQPFVDAAPLNLLYVEDADREHLVGDAAGEHYAHAEAGAMSQNVSLFCAANGLGCVVRALIDRGPLAQAMQLRERQRILLAQTVGVPL